MRRRNLLLSATTPLLLPHHARARAPVEGQQYTTLKKPQPPDDKKIEVIEFFSYACPACNAFDPSLERWTRALPADVAFRRVPVPFLANAGNFQRAFHALELMGLLPQLHGKIFEAVHVQKQPLSSPEALADLVARNGGDRAKFLETFNSFGMSAHLSRSKALTAAYDVDQIPTLAIAGRYKTSPAQAGGAAGALAVADYLVALARKPR